MSRTTRLVLSGAPLGAAIVLLLGAMWFGAVHHQIYRSDCGSVFDPRTGADPDCKDILRRREAILWAVVITGVGLGLAGVVVGKLTRSTPSDARVGPPPGSMVQRLARDVGDFVNQHYGAAWAIGLAMTCLIIVWLGGAVAVFKERPCMRDVPENWPYSADWWPGPTACADRTAPPTPAPALEVGAPGMAKPPAHDRSAPCSGSARGAAWSGSARSAAMSAH